MSVEELLAAMFPGDTARQILGFAELGLASDGLADSELAKALADLTLGKTPDVNDILRALRKSHYEQAQAFIDAALTAYFSSPAVIRALRGGPETLFPHARTLPEIDYTLLEPVVERASDND